MYLVHIKSLNFISLQNENKLHSRFFDKINMNFTSPARYRRNYMEGIGSNYIVIHVKNAEKVNHENIISRSKL